MLISTIVAVAKNNVIGRTSHNDIPWYLPADLKYFKKITLNHHIIMGRNCYESIGRALPKRTNIVVTRNPFFVASNCLVAHSIEEALGMAYDNGENEVFIIGGGQIYKESRDLWDKVYLTEVDLKVDGDVVFPTLNADHWTLASEEMHLPDEKNKHTYTFKIFERKQIPEEEG